MRRGRIFIFLALILIVILVVAAIYLNQFSGQGAVTEEPVEPATVEVYVAGQNIPQGSEVTSDLITTISIPEGQVNDVMFTVAEQGDLVGKWTKYPIEQSVVITNSMIGTKDEIAPSGPAWASGIDIGMTAFSIPTTRLSSVAFGVADGAHVNINACFLFVDVDPSYQTILPNDVAALLAPGAEPPSLTITVANPESAGNVQGRTEVEPSFQQGLYVVPSEERQRPRIVCQMLIQNVKVLKLGTFPLKEEVAPVEGDPAAEEPARVERPDIITLVVTPQDSVTLSYLIYSGAEINLALRNASDDQRVATEAATLQFLLSQYNIPVPAKLPYAMQPSVDNLTQPFLPNDVVTVPPEE
jgi:pilus assembly protein CpaB